MIEHIPRLTECGINSFKREGRMKSAYYAAVVTNAYRAAADAASEGRELSQDWISEVFKVSHRNYCTGFYFGRQHDGQYYRDSKYIRDWDVAAIVENCDDDGYARVTQRNRFWRGDKLELLMPGRLPVSFIVASMQNGDGEETEVAPHPEMTVFLRLPCKAPKYSILRREKTQND
jgi:putative protease